MSEEEKGPKRTLSVESKLDRLEQKRDTHILSEILDDLPSASKLKIYKVQNDERVYISAVSAEDFLNSGLDVHEWIKRRFADQKYGSGAYQIELVSSSGEPVKRSTISVLADNDRTGADGYSREAMEMREEAFRKLQEAAQERLEVEKQRADSSNMLGILQAFMPLIIEKSKERGVSPLDEVEKMINIANKFRGLNQEPSMFEQLLQIRMLKQMLGGGESRPKDFFTDLLENSQKFEMFKKAFGIEETEKLLETYLARQKQVAPRSEGFDRILEIAEGIQQARPVLQNLLGVNSQPAKTWTELLSTLIDKGAPHIQTIANNLVNGMITAKMIEKGLITDTGTLQAMGQWGSNSAGSVSSFIPADGEGAGRASSAPSPTRSDFGQVFDAVVNQTMSEASKLKRPLEPEEFTETVVTFTLATLRRYPNLLNDIQSVDVELPRMTSILMKRLGGEKAICESYAMEIIDRLNNKIQEGGIGNA